MGTRFFVHHRTLSALKRVEFVSDRMPYIVLKGRWYNVFLNAHTAGEEKTDDSNEFLRGIRAGFQPFS